MSTSLTHPVGSKPRASPIITARNFSIQEREAGLYHRIAQDKRMNWPAPCISIYAEENGERASSAGGSAGCS